MATQRIPILGDATPDSSGEVRPAVYTEIATNDFWEHQVWVFEDGSTKISLHGTFRVPEAYVDSASLELVWGTTATTGDVEWEFDYRAVGGNDTESLDQATAQENVGSNDTAPSSTDNRMTFSISLTDGNFLAGDTVQFKLSRDNSDAGDTIAADVFLVSAEFQFADA